MTSWQCSPRSISRLGTSDGITRSTRPGADRRKRAISAGSNRSRWKSLAAMVKVVCQRAGSNSPSAPALQLAEQFARLRRQRRLGPCGGDDAAPGLDEQRVAGDHPQLVQQVAHRRLRDTQALRRARDAAHLHHRHQQLQQARPGPTNRICSWVQS